MIDPTSLYLALRRHYWRFFQADYELRRQDIAVTDGFGNDYKVFYDPDARESFTATTISTT